MKKILDSLLFLAFFGLITSFIEATYAFGLLGTDIPPEVVCVLFLFSPLLLLLMPRALESRGFSAAMAGLALLCWAASLPLSTRWRMIAAGAGCGFFLLYLPCRLRQSPRRGAELGTAAGFGVLLSILLRALRSGNLLLAEGWPLVLGESLAAAALGLLAALHFRGPADGAGQPDGGGAGIGFPRTLGLSLGLFGALAMVYFGFTSPAAAARWGGADYTIVTAVLAASLALCLGLRPGRLPAAALLAWNAAFLLALTLTFVLRQPPLGPEAVFPFFEAEAGFPARASFWAMLALHPVLYADVSLLAGALFSGRPSPRRLVSATAAGAAALLLLSLCQIFTTVYDYIPVIGPWFRDRFWLVMILPAVLAALAVLLSGRHAADGGRSAAFRPGLLIAGAILAAATVLLSIPAGFHPAPSGTSLRILTYNIQQGYGKDGQKYYGKQLETIRKLDADVVGLQETDGARIAGGNSDVVRFLADGLGMDSYYGPTPVSGTFGVALLSRYPIRGARTFFMPSRGEQTACIEADIAVGDRLLRVLVTHLDNDGALPQQRLVIGRAAAGLAEAPLVVAMGDFNFKPSSAQYRETAAVLDDSWLAARERTVDPGAPDPAGRIDHIFVSRGTRVAAGRYLPKGVSDHPGMLAEIEW